MNGCAALDSCAGTPCKKPFVLTRGKCRFQKVFESSDKRRHPKRRETLTRGEADAGNRKEKGRDAASLGGKPFMSVACRMFEDRRNRFIRLWLYSSLRFFLAFFVLMTEQACRVWRSGRCFSGSRGLKT
jgi:hypothetical protein